jgi:predicted dehydrogenase
MKALFVGLGSIGQRHLRNFKDIVGEQSEIFVYRNTNHNTVIEDGLAFECDSIKDYYGYTQVSSLEEGLGLCPDVVFITNPSAKHIDAALLAAKSGTHIFIEKPLSHSFEGVLELQELAAENNLVVRVGYQTRYSPCFTEVQLLLTEGRYGNLISAGFEWGTYLPDHHPYENYREGYAARNSLGGGVTLGLIHEIDLIYSFFGTPKSISAIGGNLSELEMTAEDTVSALMGFEIEGRLVPVNLFLSYAQKHEVRTFRLQFVEGLLVCDLLSNSILVYGSKGDVLLRKEYGLLDRNDMFKAQLGEFIDAVRVEDTGGNTLVSGAETLSIALAIRDHINE